MKCSSCDCESTSGGILVEEYSGDDVNNLDLINKLSLYLFNPDSFIHNNNLRYRGWDLNTAIRARNNQIDYKKETIKMVVVDENIFNKLKEIWNKK